MGEKKRMVQDPANQEVRVDHQDYIPQPADILHTAAPNLLGWMIRFCSTHPGEAKTLVSHSAIVCRAIDVAHWVEKKLKYKIPEKEWTDPWVVEAHFPCVKAVKWRTWLDKNPAWESWRKIGLDEVEMVRDGISTEAGSFLGYTYGVTKIFAHAIDFLLSIRASRNVYWLRNICRIPNIPICSGVVALAYDRTVNYRFLGLDPLVVQPDDIHDDQTRKPHIWQRMGGTIGGR